MALKPVCHRMSCPGGERQCRGSALFVFGLFSRFGQAVLCPPVAGVQAGRALRGWGEVRVGRGHCSRCFLSVRRGGFREHLMTETSGSLTSPPLSLTPPSPDMCQSVPGQYGGPVRLPVHHVLPRQGLAAPHSAAHQHESFSPPSTCQVCRDHGI